MNEPKTALITGSYGGLGAAFAAEHARRGGALILSDLNRERLEKQKHELEARYNVTVDALPADLTRPEETQRLFTECRARNITLDHLILNAGFGGQGTLAKRPMEKDMAMIAVNVEATTRLLKLFLPGMVERGFGRVLLVSSISAKLPGPRQAVYFASKAYLTSLGNALWRELKGTGVTLTTVMPGILATDFAEKGHLEDTLLFARRADPEKAAKKAYDAMLRGKMNVTPCVQLPLRLALLLTPFLPKALVTELVYCLQKKGTSSAAQ
ncbi:MAG: SDR family NAD(P)-dependent oxidoreductase [Clostridia bacterium]|nr:SDR family NAD(P)-dependent oxidoreductase [Clostridia bacterium]